MLTLLDHQLPCGRLPLDLASILGRHEDGSPLNIRPSELLAYDPVLRNVKLIAEAWDAGGLYQVGSFPASRRWLNGMAVTVTAPFLPEGRFLECLGRCMEYFRFR